MKDGLVDALIVYQLDRISRNVRDFSNIYALLEEKNIMFISIKENIDTATPIGRAMMYVTMVFAQVERENISARTADNLYSKTINFTKISYASCLINVKIMA